ncbi:MAG: leucine-rich repeat protein [Lachnospirales bacterium]
MKYIKMKVLIMILCMMSINLCCVWGITTDLEPRTIFPTSSNSEQSAGSSTGNYVNIEDVVRDNLREYCVDGGKIYYNPEFGAVVRVEPTVKITAIPEEINGVHIGSIEKEAFWGCGITKITIPDSVAYIASEAFKDCVNLEEIKLPQNSSFSRIEYATFKGCKNLKSIEIPNSVDFIGIAAFSDCENLSCVNFSNSKELTISSDAFSNCTSLHEILCKSDFVCIESMAFFGCKDIHIKVSSLADIDDDAFGGCTNYKVDFFTDEEMGKYKRIKIYVNDIELNLDYDPVLYNGSVLVPMRAILETFDASVNWDSEKHLVTVIKDDIEIQMYPNSTVAYINGVSSEMPSSKLIDGHIMVPVRFISEVLDAEVKWNGDSKGVYIYI